MLHTGGRIPQIVFQSLAFMTQKAFIYDTKGKSTGMMCPRGATTFVMCFKRTVQSSRLVSMPLWSSDGLNICMHSPCL